VWSWGWGVGVGLFPFPPTPSTWHRHPIPIESFYELRCLLKKRGCFLCNLLWSSFVQPWKPRCDQKTTRSTGRTDIRSRFPRCAVSGQWKKSCVREVGKKDLKLWEKDWLRRCFGKGRECDVDIHIGVALSFFNLSKPIPQLFHSDWNPTV